LFPLVLALPLLFGLFNRPQQIEVKAPETQVAGTTTDAIAVTPPVAEEPVAQVAPAEAAPVAEPAPAEPTPEPAPAAVEPAPVAAEPVCSALSVSTTTPGATIQVMDGETVLGSSSGPEASFDCLKVATVQVKVSAPGYADFLDSVSLPHEAMVVKLEPNVMGK
jgi:hypothetical protein